MTHVLVIGGGNAGFCAAQAAVRAGATATILEKAPAEAAGGNSFYTAGAFRVVHDGLDAVMGVIDDDTTRARARVSSLDPYPPEAFRDDMERLTEGRCDPELTGILIGDSQPVVEWLAEVGIRWRLMYERQSYERDGQFVFWGGLALGTVDGGKGLIAQHTAAAQAAGIERALRHRGDRAGAGWRAARGRERARGRRRGARRRRLRGQRGAARAPPGRGLGACAGARQPAQHRRGAARRDRRGAARFGDWSACHSVAWDAEADEGGGDRELTNQYTRSGYPLGVMVNRDGRRFVDEGADFRNYTYARYGREILAQPGGVAFQLFDANLRPLLRSEEYDAARVTGAQADTLAELAGKLGIDAAAARGARCASSTPRSATTSRSTPAVKDGRAAEGIEPPKSHWAQALETPPYYGFAVTCGVTFTFGGVHIDEHARVLDDDGAPIPGLYAAGELVGGLFHGNYPGGTGLTAGAVFGRRAGTHAATA